MPVDEITSGTFFIMPGNALRSLRNELQILNGEKEAEDTLERYGYRCGEGLVKELGIKCSKFGDLKDALPPLLSQTGLGRSTIKHISEGEIVIVFDESVESSSTPKSTAATNCNFTRGYLAGVVSALVSQKFSCIEEECMSRDGVVCTHRLSRTPEQLPRTSGEGVAKAILHSVEEDRKKIKHPLGAGESYLIEESVPQKSYQIFVDYVTHGYNGMCISREYPDKIRKLYNLQSAFIIWLTKAEREDAIEPEKISLLYHKIESFLSDCNESGVVLLSGVEYLISQNNFNTVLKFIQLIRDQVAIHRSILIVPISPLTVEQRDLKMIEREIEILKDEEK